MRVSAATDVGECSHCDPPPLVKTFDFEPCVTQFRVTLFENLFLGGKIGRVKISKLGIAAGLMLECRDRRRVDKVNEVVPEDGPWIATANRELGNLGEHTVD